MRIVSLLGSATEIVYELGLGEHLVGISHECDYPPEATRLPRLSRPRFEPAGLTSGELDAAVRRAMQEHGSVFEVDASLLAELHPDVVLTQGVCEVCAVPTGSVEHALASPSGNVEVVSLDAHTVEGILATVEQVADAAGYSRAGVELRGRLHDRLDAVQSTIAGATRPRAMLLEWLDPPFAPGHWVPQMVEMAGCENLLGTAGSPSVQVDWAQLEPLQPDIVLVEPCGFDLDQAYADATRARESLLRVGRHAIEQGHAWVLHSAWFSRSGPRIVEGVETLARLLHPTRFPHPASSRIARRWP